MSHHLNNPSFRTSLTRRLSSCRIYNLVFRFRSSAKLHMMCGLLYLWRPHASTGLVIISRLYQANAEISYLLGTDMTNQMFMAPCDMRVVWEMRIRWPDFMIINLI
jgi:hypothetical protein